MFTNKQIARHFELCEEHYQYWWGLKKSKSMHYGYWDENTNTLHDALMNINKVMSAKAGITENSKVLDAGCGIGGSSLWLGQNIGCNVVGITLSEIQKNKATQTASSLNLSEKVLFLQEDYCNTSFSDASFDIVWAIESVCYAHSKYDFIKEAYRVLKPGGKLIVADFFKREGLEGKDKELMNVMAKGWAVSDFSTIEDFEKFTDKAGFTKRNTEDISKAITPSSRKLYLYSFPGMFFTKLYDLIFTATELTKHHARTVNVQYPLLKRSAWKYYLFIAEK